MNLKEWGWNNTPIEEGYIPGRVVKESKHIYEVVTEEGRFSAKVSGKFKHNTQTNSDYPTIGDWVAVQISDEIAVIHQLIPRKSSFTRKRPGSETVEQVIASNIDYIFMVFALDGGRNYSPGAVERFVTTAWDSGSNPVIILNKTDLCETPDDFLYETEMLAPGVPVHLSSTVTMEGIESLRSYFKTGKTVAFTGFSGVGKSALINALCGEETMRTGKVRNKDQKGRHTTTHKELILLKDGGLIIDSPGIRELQLWGDTDSLENSFEDISELAENCRFRDCSHTGEPGCAVQAALATGELDHRRFENYLDLRKELAYLESKLSVKAILEDKAKNKNLAKLIRSIQKK